MEPRRWGSSQEPCRGCSTGLWLPSVMLDIDVWWITSLTHGGMARERLQLRAGRQVGGRGGCIPHLLLKANSFMVWVPLPSDTACPCTSTAQELCMTWGKKKWCLKEKQRMLSSQQTGRICILQRLSHVFVKLNVELALSGWGCCHGQEQHCLKAALGWEITGWCLVSLGPGAVSLHSCVQRIRHARNRVLRQSCHLGPWGAPRAGTGGGGRFLRCRRLIRHHGKAFPSA